MKELQVKLETDTNDADLDKILRLLKAYNRAEIEFCLDFCELEEVIKYYINRELDINLDDLGVLIDIEPNPLEGTTNIRFDTNDIDNVHELDYIKKEFKKHFGVNILNCNIRKVLMILLIDCCAYEVYNDYITISFSADNLRDNWLFKYFKDNE